MKSKDSLIETICNSTGISRRDLAILTGGNQSTMSRYQKGERTLPTEPLIQMTKLVTLIKSLPTVPKLAASEKDRQTLLERAAWCRAQCYPLQKKLEEMETTAKQAATALLMVNAFLADTSLSKKKKNWAEVVRLTAEKKLKKCNWLAQRELAVKIEVLKNEATMYEAVNA